MCYAHADPIRVHAGPRRVLRGSHAGPTRVPGRSYAGRGSHGSHAGTAEVHVSRVGFGNSYTVLRGYVCAMPTRIPCGSTWVPGGSYAGPRVPGGSYAAPTQIGPTRVLRVPGRCYAGPRRGPAGYRRVLGGPQAGPTWVTRVSSASYASQTDPRRSQAGPTRAPGGSYRSYAGPLRGSAWVPRQAYAGFMRASRVPRLSRVLRASQASPTRVPGGPTACRASDLVLLVTWVGPLRRSQLCVESRKVEVSDTQNEDAPAGSRTRGTSMGGLYVAATLQVPLRLVIRLA